MGNDIYMPNCCFSCLQEPFAFASLDASLESKTVEFKEFHSHNGDSWTGTTTNLITTYNLPICDKCKKKDTLFELFMFIFTFIFPFITYALLSYLFGFLIQALDIGEIGKGIFGITLTVIVISSIITSVFIFKLRLSFGLEKRSFIAKKLKFKNKDYDRLFKEINIGNI